MFRLICSMFFRFSCGVIMFFLLYTFGSVQNVYTYLFQVFSGPPVTSLCFFYSTLLDQYWIFKLICSMLFRFSCGIMLFFHEIMRHLAVFSTLHLQISPECFHLIGTLCVLQDHETSCCIFYSTSSDLCWMFNLIGMLCVLQDHGTSCLYFLLYIFRSVLNV